MSLYKLFNEYYTHCQLEKKKKSNLSGITGMPLTALSAFIFDVIKKF